MPMTPDDMQDLYRHHGSAVLAFILARTHTPTLAEDGVQETFVRAFGMRRELADVDSPRAWLLGIARNVVRESYRAAMPAVERVDAVPERQAASPLPADEVQTVREAIARLPCAQREALELRMTHDLSYAEMATVLEAPIGTVRSRLHHAIRALRLSLAGDER